MFADNIEVEAAYEEDAEISQVRKKERRKGVIASNFDVVGQCFDGSSLFFMQARLLPRTRLLLSFALHRV